MAFVSTIAGLPLVSQPSLTNVVFLGFPSRRSLNQIGNNETKSFTGKEHEEFLCMVSKKDGEYFWTSRDNKRVIRNVSGAFVIYTALDGSGYVKCSNALPDSPLDYMEHLHVQFSTVRYWGKSSIQRE